MRSMRGQGGFTLLDGIASLAVMGAVMGIAGNFMSQYARETAARNTAQHMRAVGEAAQAYIRDNASTIAAGATSTSPYTITVSALVSAGYLPSGFLSINGYRHTVCVQVLEPAANRLEGMVVATGGRNMTDAELEVAKLAIGGPGGAVYSGATTASGTGGGWSLSVTRYASKTCTGFVSPVTLASHPVMALWIGDNDVATSFLYRSPVTGRPELNRMATTLDMGGYRITNLQAVATIGSPCDAGVNTGDLASGPNGEVLSCQSGTWERQSGGSAYWGDPVDQSVAMPACAAGNANETRVRYGYATAPTRRMFVCDGATWQPAGVDHTGNLTIPGNLAVGSATVGGALSSTATGTVATGTLEIKQTVTEGDACTTNGAVASDSNGVLLSCQSGVWQRSTISCTWSGIRGVYGDAGGCYDDVYIECKDGNVKRMYFGC